VSEIVTGQTNMVVLQQLLRKLVQTYQPQQVILFGSLAYGHPDEHSDIDLLIVKETDETPLERRVHVRRLVADPARQIPFSPLVLTPTELTQRLKLGDPFYQEILARGKVLYPYA
jgi:predicted nucleotidyltransferase